MSNTFDAVYYSQQVPTSPASLTVLGLVFDRLHFPGVHIPSGGFDREAVAAEIKRIKTTMRKIDVDTAQMLQCMEFALHREHLADLCVFTGTAEDVFGSTEEGTEKLAYELEKAIFGPPPSNFIPMLSEGHTKGLPGDGPVAIRYPGWLHYPASAFIYAARHRLPLINDNPNLPVPGLGGLTSNEAAKLRAAILALESVKFALPQLPVLSIEELAEFRAETREYTTPFRQEMLRLSNNLNDAIQSDADIADLQEMARVTTETSIKPAMEELRAELASASKPWHKRLLTYAPFASSIGFAFFGTKIALASAFVNTVLAVVKEATDQRDAHRDRERKIKNNGFYYLLKLEDRFRR